MFLRPISPDDTSRAEPMASVRPILQKSFLSRRPRSDLKNLILSTRVGQDPDPRGARRSAAVMRLYRPQRHVRQQAGPRLAEPRRTDARTVSPRVDLLLALRVAST